MEIFGTLVALAEDQTEENSFIIQKRKFIIGSHTFSDIILPEPSNSLGTRHCEIVIDPFGRVSLINHDKIAILLNGDELKRSRPLEPGSIIEIGNHKFRWEKRPITPEPSQAEKHIIINEKSYSDPLHVDKLKRERDKDIRVARKLAYNGRFTLHSIANEENDDTQLENNSSESFIEPTPTPTSETTSINYSIEDKENIPDVKEEPESPKHVLNTEISQYLISQSDVSGDCEILDATAEDSIIEETQKDKTLTPQKEDDDDLIIFSTPAVFQPEKSIINILSDTDEDEFEDCKILSPEKMNLIDEIKSTTIKCELSTEIEIQHKPDDNSIKSDNNSIKTKPPEEKLNDLMSKSFENFSENKFNTSAENITIENVSTVDRSVIESLNDEDIVSKENEYLSITESTEKQINLELQNNDTDEKSIVQSSDIDTKNNKHENSNDKQIRSDNTSVNEVDLSLLTPPLRLTRESLQIASVKMLPKLKTIDNDENKINIPLNDSKELGDSETLNKNEEYSINVNENIENPASLHDEKINNDIIEHQQEPTNIIDYLNESTPPLRLVRESLWVTSIKSSRKLSSNHHNTNEKSNTTLGDDSELESTNLESTVRNKLRFSVESTTNEITNYDESNNEIDELPQPSPNDFEISQNLIVSNDEDIDNTPEQTKNENQLNMGNIMQKNEDQDLKTTNKIDEFEETESTINKTDENIESTYLSPLKSEMNNSHRTSLRLSCTKKLFSECSFDFRKSIAKKTLEIGNLPNIKSTSTINVNKINNQELLISTEETVNNLPNENEPDSRTIFDDKTNKNSLNHDATNCTPIKSLPLKRKGSLTNIDITNSISNEQSHETSGRTLRTRRASLATLNETPKKSLTTRHGSINDLNTPNQVEDTPTKILQKRNRSQSALMDDSTTETPTRALRTTRTRSVTQVRNTPNRSIRRTRSSSGFIKDETVIVSDKTEDVILEPENVIHTPKTTILKQKPSYSKGFTPKSIKKLRMETIEETIHSVTSKNIISIKSELIESEISTKLSMQTDKIQSPSVNIIETTSKHIVKKLLRDENKEAITSTSENIIKSTIETTNNTPTETIKSKTISSNNEEFLKEINERPTLTKNIEQENNVILNPIAVETKESSIDNNIFNTCENIESLSANIIESITENALETFEENNENANVTKTIEHIIEQTNKVSNINENKESSSENETVNISIGSLSTNINEITPTITVDVIQVEPDILHIVENTKTNDSSFEKLTEQTNEDVHLCVTDESEPEDEACNVSVTIDSSSPNIIDQTPEISMDNVKEVKSSANKVENIELIDTSFDIIVQQTNKETTESEITESLTDYCIKNSTALIESLSPKTVELASENSLEIESDIKDENLKSIDASSPNIIDPTPEISVDTVKEVNSSANKVENIELIDTSFDITEEQTNNETISSETTDNCINNSTVLIESLSPKTVELASKIDLEIENDVKDVNLKIIDSSSCNIIDQTPEISVDKVKEVNSSANKVENTELIDTSFDITVKQTNNETIASEITESLTDNCTNNSTGFIESISSKTVELASEIGLEIERDVIEENLKTINSSLPKIIDQTPEISVDTVKEVKSSANKVKNIALIDKLLDITEEQTNNDTIASETTDNCINNSTVLIESISPKTVVLASEVDLKIESDVKDENLKTIDLSSPNIIDPTPEIAVNKVKEVNSSANNVENTEIIDTSFDIIVKQTNKETTESEITESLTVNSINNSTVLIESLSPKTVELASKIDLEIENDVKDVNLKIIDSSSCNIIDQTPEIAVDNVKEVNSSTNKVENTELIDTSFDITVKQTNNETIASETIESLTDNYINSSTLLIEPISPKTVELTPEIDLEIESDVKDENLKTIDSSSLNIIDPTPEISVDYVKELKSSTNKVENTELIDTSFDIIVQQTNKETTESEITESLTDNCIKNSTVLIESLSPKTMEVASEIGLEIESDCKEEDQKTIDSSFEQTIEQPNENTDISKTIQPQTENKIENIFVTTESTAETIVSTPPISIGTRKENEQSKIKDSALNQIIVKQTSEDKNMIVATKTIENDVSETIHSDVFELTPKITEDTISEENRIEETNEATTKSIITETIELLSENDIHSMNFIESPSATIVNTIKVDDEIEPTETFDFSPKKIVKQTNKTVNISVATETEESSSEHEANNVSVLIQLTSEIVVDAHLKEQHSSDITKNIEAVCLSSEAEIKHTNKPTNLSFIIETNNLQVESSSPDLFDRTSEITVDTNEEEKQSIAISKNTETIDLSSEKIIEKTNATINKSSVSIEIEKLLPKNGAKNISVTSEIAMDTPQEKDIAENINEIDSLPKNNIEQTNEVANISISLETKNSAQKTNTTNVSVTEIVMEKITKEQENVNVVENTVSIDSSVGIIVEQTNEDTLLPEIKEAASDNKIINLSVTTESLSSENIELTPIIVVDTHNEETQNNCKAENKKTIDSSFEKILEQTNENTVTSKTTETIELIPENKIVHKIIEIAPKDVVEIIKEDLQIAEVTKNTLEKSSENDILNISKTIESPPTIIRKNTLDTIKNVEETTKLIENSQPTSQNVKDMIENKNEIKSKAIESPLTNIVKSPPDILTEKIIELEKCTDLTANIEKVNISTAGINLETINELLTPLNEHEPVARIIFDDKTNKKPLNSSTPIGTPTRSLRTRKGSITNVDISSNVIPDDQTLGTPIRTLRTRKESFASTNVKPSDTPKRTLRTRKESVADINTPNQTNDHELQDNPSQHLLRKQRKGSVSTVDNIQLTLNDKSTVTPTTRSSRTTRTRSVTQCLDIPTRSLRRTRSTSVLIDETDGMNKIVSEEIEEVISQPENIINTPKSTTRKQKGSFLKDFTPKSARKLKMETIDETIKNVTENNTLSPKIEITKPQTNSMPMQTDLILSLSTNENPQCIENATNIEEHKRIINNDLSMDKIAQKSNEELDKNIESDKISSKIEINKTENSITDNTENKIDNENATTNDTSLEMTAEETNKSINLSVTTETIESSHKIEISKVSATTESESTDVIEFTPEVDVKKIKEEQEITVSKSMKRIVEPQKDKTHGSEKKIKLEIKKRGRNGNALPIKVSEEPARKTRGRQRNIPIVSKDSSEQEEIIKPIQLESIEISKIDKNGKNKIVKKEENKTKTTYEVKAVEETSHETEKPVPISRGRKKKVGNEKVSVENESVAEITIEQEEEKKVESQTKNIAVAKPETKKLTRNRKNSELLIENGESDKLFIKKIENNTEIPDPQKIEAAPKTRGRKRNAGTVNVSVESEKINEPEIEGNVETQINSETVTAKSEIKKLGRKRKVQKLISENDDSDKLVMEKTEDKKSETLSDVSTPKPELKTIKKGGKKKMVVSFKLKPSSSPEQDLSTDCLVKSKVSPQIELPVTEIEVPEQPKRQGRTRNIGEQMEKISKPIGRTRRGTADSLASNSEKPETKTRGRKRNVSVAESEEHLNLENGTELQSSDQSESLEPQKKVVRRGGRQKVVTKSIEHSSTEVLAKGNESIEEEKPKRTARNRNATKDTQVDVAVAPLRSLRSRK